MCVYMCRLLHLAVVSGKTKLVEALLDRLEREHLLEHVIKAVNNQFQVLRSDILRNF